jgi:hypothetical protein
MHYQYLIARSRGYKQEREGKVPKSLNMLKNLCIECVSRVRSPFLSGRRSPFYRPRRQPVRHDFSQKGSLWCKIVLEREIGSNLFLNDFGG